MTNEATPDAAEAALCKAFEEFLAKRARRAKEVARLEESLRSLLPDVRACAEYIVERGVDNADGSARRILAALDSFDSQGGEGE